jgi:hypothetical protein
LTLTEEAKEFVTIWLSALNHVLNGGSKEVMLEGTDTGADRRMSILKKVPTMKTRASMTLPGTTLRQFLEDGRVMTIYENPEQPTKKKVYIYYRRDTSPSGSLFWCEPGQREEHRDRCLPLHTVTLSLLLFWFLWTLPD